MGIVENENGREIVSEMEWKFRNFHAVAEFILKPMPRWYPCTLTMKNVSVYVWETQYVTKHVIVVNNFHLYQLQSVYLCHSIYFISFSLSPSFSLSLSTFVPAASFSVLV